MAVADAVVEEIAVDPSQIEKGLSNLWRGKEGDEQTLTRAALWNVVAHTVTPEQQALAAETLSKATRRVPSRTIIVRSNPAAAGEISSSIGANFLPYGGGRQIYAEEINIVAGGDRVHRVPPLVSSLLIPDMPVGVWWLGDLPTEREEYVEAILAPADRLIVNSMHFDDSADLALVSRIAEQTITAPADLNWIRLEEWRAATASIFDPPNVRGRLPALRKVRVVSGTSEAPFFGESVEGLLFASWLSAQLGHQVDAQGRVEGPGGSVNYAFESRRQTRDVGRIAFVELRFNDGSSASISRDLDRGILTANIDGTETIPGSITRTRSCAVEDLIVRQLKRPEGDPVFVKTLPIATRLAKRVNK